MITKGFLTDTIVTKGIGGILVVVVAKIKKVIRLTSSITRIIQKISR